MQSNPDVNKRLITIREASKLSGFGLYAITQGIKNGSIPAVKLGRKIMINRSRFETFLEGSSTNSGKAA